jgi:hypothetical protein
LEDAASRRGSSRAGFILTEETKASPTTDTGRFLAAGAKRAFWLRARAGSLNKAVPVLLQALKGERNVIIESTSVMEYLAPNVCLIVFGSSRRGFKANTRRALARADAIVQVEANTVHPTTSPLVPRGVPVFPVPRGSYFCADLCRFVRRELESSSGTRPHLPRTSRRAGIAERS